MAVLTFGIFEGAALLPPVFFPPFPPFPFPKPSPPAIMLVPPSTVGIGGAINDGFVLRIECGCVNKLHATDCFLTVLLVEKNEGIRINDTQLFMCTGSPNCIPSSSNSPTVPESMSVAILLTFMLVLAASVRISALLSQHQYMSKSCSKVIQGNVRQI